MSVRQSEAPKPQSGFMAQSQLLALMKPGVLQKRAAGLVGPPQLYITFHLIRSKFSNILICYWYLVHNNSSKMWKQERALRYNSYTVSVYLHIMIGNQWTLRSEFSGVEDGIGQRCQTRVDLLQFTFLLHELAVDLLVDYLSDQRLGRKDSSLTSTYLQ